MCSFSTKQERKIEKARILMANVFPFLLACQFDFKYPFHFPASRTYFSIDPQTKTPCFLLPSSTKCFPSAWATSFDSSLFVALVPSSAFASTTFRPSQCQRWSEFPYFWKQRLSGSVLWPFSCPHCHCCWDLNHRCSINDGERDNARLGSHWHCLSRSRDKKRVGLGVVSLHLCPFIIHPTMFNSSALADKKKSHSSGHPKLVQVWI